MPCYTLTLEKKNKVYRLSELITSQYDLIPPIATAWQSVSIQASYDNIDKNGNMIPIKCGDETLTGFRYGRVLMPGEPREYREHYFTKTDDKYFLCEEANNMQLLVELL